MNEIKYNKLVRDRIPEIIEASGKTCSTEILPREDYLRMLDAKLPRSYGRCLFEAKIGDRMQRQSKE